MAERLRTHTWLFAAGLALALLIANVAARADLRRARQLARPAGGAGAVRDRRDGLDARDPFRRRRPRHLDRADRRARQRRPDRVAARARRRGQCLAGDPDRGAARRRHRRAQRRPGGRLSLPVGDRHAVHVLRAGGRHRQDRAGAEDRAGGHVAHRPRRHGRSGPGRAAARRRSAGRLVAAVADGVSPQSLRRRRQRRDGLQRRHRRHDRARARLQPRRGVRRRRRRRPHGARELDAGVGLRPVHPDRAGRGRAGRDAAGRRPRRARGVAARRVLHLLHADAAGRARGLERLAELRLRLPARGRRRRRREAAHPSPARRRSA